MQSKNLPKFYVGTPSCLGIFWLQVRGQFLEGLTLSISCCFFVPHAFLERNCEVKDVKGSTKLLSEEDLL